jgi:phosphoribosyl 1,2-cyclic phosphodiesterase
MTVDGLDLHFLGTGGGRHVMSSQMRRTAGIRIVHDDTHVHIDPGPGALVFSNRAQLSPRKLDALIVTHCHPDHYSDAEVFVEAMTNGTHTRKGILAATASVLDGAEGIGPSISEYHKGLVRDLLTLERGTQFSVDALDFIATEARHSDPNSVGLRIETPYGTIGYSSDTGYFKGVSEQYKENRLLILCTVWPRSNPIHIHLNTDDALRLIQEAKPKACILTHFGVRMLRAGPEEEAEYLQNETGVPVIAAVDGMRAVIGDDITVVGPRKKDGPVVLDV